VRGGWNVTFDELAIPGASAFGRGYPYWSERVIPSSVFPIPADDLAATLAGSSTPLDQASNPQYYSFPRDLRSPRTYAWQVGLERALGPVQRLGLAYVGSAGRDLTYAYTIYGAEHRSTVQAFSNDARSDSRALLAEYVRRLSHGVEARVAYAWSRTIDTDSGEGPAPQAPPSLVPPRQNRGYADFDRRHVFNGSVSLHLPPVPVRTTMKTLTRDWQLDLGWSLRSGAPYSVTVTQDVGYGSYTVRPDLVSDAVWKDFPTDPTKRVLNSTA